MKQLAPRVLAALLLIALLPLLMLLGLGVQLWMGHPVLFRQQRTGLAGSTFTLIKLRSMRYAVDAAGHPLPDEDRTPLFGRFLRRSRLDELPGLWNVMTGDMAVVGPRPLLPETIHSLGSAGVARGAVRPGLTGWAQVNGNTLLTLDEKVSLDLWYVGHASLLLDLRIVWMTVRVMIGGEQRTSDSVKAQR